MTQALTLVLAAAAAYSPKIHVSKMPHVEPHIVNGSYDPGDPAVIELFAFIGFDPSECNGNSSCLQSCQNASGQACSSSGSGCFCGSGFVCTGELIGPHTVLTAGHCTDLTPGGEISGQGGPPMTVCTNPNDANNVLSGTPDSSCNLVIFAIFNNTCTSNDANSDCEFGLIEGVDGGGGGGNFILVDQVVNPGYNGNATPPQNDNDVGLCHLSQTTLENGGAEPALLTFNRTNEGKSCTDLGSLKFVGYGITSGSGQTAGVKMSVSHDSMVLDDYHNFEGNNPYSNCGSAGSSEPTCSGDSGGPALSSTGVIMATTSLGDPQCQSFGQDCRADAFTTFYDCQMQCWTDPLNGGASAPDCSGYSCVYAPTPVTSSSSSSSSGGVTSATASSGSSSGGGSSSSGGSSVATSGASGTGSSSSGQPASSSSRPASGSSSAAASSAAQGSSSSGGGAGSTSPSSPTGPAPHATPPAGSSGCSSAPGGAADASSFGALLALGLALLRRRAGAGA